MINTIILTYILTTTNGTAEVPYSSGPCFCAKHNPKYECQVETVIDNGNLIRTVSTTYENQPVRDNVTLECGETL